MKQSTTRHYLPIGKKLKVVTMNGSLSIFYYPLRKSSKRLNDRIFTQRKQLKHRAIFKLAVC